MIVRTSEDEVISISSDQIFLDYIGRVFGKRKIEGGLPCLLHLDPNFLLHSSRFVQWSHIGLVRLCLLDWSAQYRGS